MKNFSKMTRKDLEKYVDFLLWQYRVVDALWFLAVEDKALFRVLHCPPQEARLKHGRKEFPCKAMHL